MFGGPSGEMHPGPFISTRPTLTIYEYNKRYTRYLWNSRPIPSRARTSKIITINIAARSRCHPLRS